MKTKRLMVLIGSVCLALMLAAPLMLACTAPSPSPSPTTAPSPTPSPSPTTAPSPSTPPAQEKYTWRFNGHNSPATASQQFFLNRLPGIIEEYTKGRVQIEVFSGGELMANDQVFEACAKGTLEMYDNAPGYVQGFIPVANVEQGLPCTYRTNWEVFTHFYDYGLADILEQEYGSRNVKYLVPIPFGKIGLWANKPVNNIADLKDLKVLSFGAWLELLEELGASSMYLPTTERYTALMQGVADASVTVPKFMYDNKFYEALDYYILPEWLFGTNDQICMNLDLWESLDEVLQDQLMAALTKASILYCGERYKDAVVVQSLCQEVGMEFVTMSDYDDVVAAAETIWDRIAEEDSASAQGIETLKNYLRDMNYIK